MQTFKTEKPASFGVGWSKKRNFLPAEKETVKTIKKPPGKGGLLVSLAYFFVPNLESAMHALNSSCVMGSYSINSMLSLAIRASDSFKQSNVLIISTFSKYWLQNLKTRKPTSSGVG